MGGNTTNLDPDDEQVQKGFAQAMLQLLDEWDSAANHDERVFIVHGTLTDSDDFEPDTLTGSSGRDLFFAELDDSITDLKTKQNPETVL